MKELYDIFKYSELLKNLVIRDIKVRYKRSVLGFLWVMLNPLLMMVILNIIFSELFKTSAKNYTAYLITGIVFWNFYSQSTSIAVSSFVSNANLIKKIYLPKSLFPLSVVCSAMVNLIFSLIPLFIIILLSDANLSPYIYMLPIVMILSTIFIYSISLCIATFMVFFHDIKQIYEVLLFALMYMTPIFYPIEIVPQKYRFVIDSNPLTHFIELFRSTIYADTPFSFERLFYLIIMTLSAYLIGNIIYLKLKDKIVYQL
ncbi:MAG: ABC transporter permease [Thermodesulfovibrionales bacterium]|nr:ABC transporter permease [Thermodesulfovibrionales bacterium]